MTDDLRELMHDRAVDADLLAPDLTTITTIGRRRARRRRTMTAGAAVLVVVVVGGGGLLATHHADRSGGSGPATASDQGIVTTGLTWAQGSTLHVGDQTYDLGHRISAYVRTAVGYVFSSPDGTVWSAHDGAVTEVGSVSPSSAHLVSSADSGLAGWVDESGADPTFVILDQETGAITTSRAAPGTTRVGSDASTAAKFEAIDGQAAYWHDAGGQSTTTYLPAGDGSDDASMITEPRHDSTPVLAARSDALVLQQPDAGSDGVVVQQPDGTRTTIEHQSAEIAQLSAGGAYVNIDGDSPLVFDAHTGRQIGLDVHGFFADGYQWLDDHTLAVLALPTKTSDWQLLTCTVPNGACTVAVPHLGAPYHQNESDVGFAVPIGIALGDG